MTAKKPTPKRPKKPDKRLQQLVRDVAELRTDLAVMDDLVTRLCTVIGIEPTPPTTEGKK